MISKEEIEQAKEFENNLSFYFQGDNEAITLMLHITAIAHIWDDLIDKDKEVSDLEINRAFITALVDIPANKFYQAFQSELRPLIMNAILQWQDANALEKGSGHDKHMAYMLRASILQIVNYIAYIIGGNEWIEEHGADIRRMYTEDFFDFIEEVK